MKIREGSLKKAGVVMSFFAVGCTGFAVSCTGLDRHLSGTLNPYGNPNTPDTRSETAQRVRGAKVTATPVVAEDGDVWPGQPEPVPSLRDVSRSDAHFIEKWQKARPQLDADLRQQLGDGQGMSVGEDVNQRYGSGRDVMPIGKPIASHVKDNAPPYMESVNRGIVVIPNGDGTDTLIAPDGSLKIVSHSKAALFEHAKTFGRGHGSDGTGTGGPTYAQPDNGYVTEVPRHQQHDDEQEDLSVPPALRHPRAGGAAPQPHHDMPVNPPVMVAIPHPQSMPQVAAVPQHQAPARPPVVETPHPQSKPQVVAVPQHQAPAKPPVVEAPHPQPKPQVAAVPQHQAPAKPPVVEAPHPQPRPQVAAVPQHQAPAKPPVVEAPHPQPKPQVVAVQHHQAPAKPPVVEAPHPQPKPQVVAVQHHQAPAKPSVVEAPHPQPKPQIVAEKEHPVRHKASAGHSHAEAMVSAAEPVMEFSQSEKRVHKTQSHRIEVASAKTEHHPRKKGSDYVDALGFEAPVRHARSHHNDGVYQFDWDK